MDTPYMFVSFNPVLTFAELPKAHLFQDLNDTITLSFLRQQLSYVHHWCNKCLCHCSEYPCMTGDRLLARSGRY
jgi:hypothetical protein